MVFRIDEINICVFSFCCMGLVDIYCERKPNFRITKRLCVPNHHLPILLSIHEINFLQNMFFIYVRQLFNTHICKYVNIWFPESLMCSGIFRRLRKCLKRNLKLAACRRQPQINGGGNFQILNSSRKKVREKNKQKRFSKSNPACGLCKPPKEGLKTFSLNFSTMLETHFFSALIPPCIKRPLFKNLFRRKTSSPWVIGNLPSPPAKCLWGFG